MIAYRYIFLLIIIFFCYWRKGIEKQINHVISFENIDDAIIVLHLILSEQYFLGQANLTSTIIYLLLKNNSIQKLSTHLVSKEITNHQMTIHLSGCLSIAAHLGFCG